MGSTYARISARLRGRTSAEGWSPPDGSSATGRHKVRTDRNVMSRHALQPMRCDNAETEGLTTLATATGRG